MVGQAASSLMQTKVLLAGRYARLTCTKNIVLARPAEGRQEQGAPATYAGSVWLKAIGRGFHLPRSLWKFCFQIVSLVQSTFTFIIQQRSAGHRAESVCGFSFPGMIRGIITVLGKIIKPESDVGSKLRVQPHTGQELRRNDTRA